MRMIVLNRQSAYGEVTKVWINPAHIVSIQERTNDHRSSLVMLTTGSFDIRERPDEVAGRFATATGEA